MRCALRQDGGVGGAVTRVPGDVLVHLRHARDHADRAYAEPLDLDALAAIAGVGATSTGCSPRPTG